MLSKRSRLPPLLFVLSLSFGSFLYVFRCSINPPGFFVDESSIAYNAYTISQSGTDEFGNRWPLFFRAFGDYKNPVYIYLMALVFRVVGPSILAARLQGAILGVLAAVLLGLLARRLARDTASNSREASLVGLIVMTTAFLTPWFFEISRVVLEVALYPLVVVLFLFYVYRSSKQRRWSWANILCLSLTLALLTYTYSIGRLLAPLLAFGLILFATRERWEGIIRTWAIYLLTLVPLISYQREHAGALTERFKLVSNIKPGDSWLMILWVFVKHYLGNIDPRRLFVLGDPNIYQVTHLYGKPVLLFATLLLLIIGTWRAARECWDRFCWERRRPRLHAEMHTLATAKSRRTQQSGPATSNAWWRFVVYGAIVSVVPASLTVDYLHMLRLVALPVFLLVLTIPALTWLLERKRLVRNASLVILIVMTLGQGLAFQFQYQNRGNSPWRRRLFDADYPDKIFNLAMHNGTRPFYVSDPLNTPYIQAYWYGTLQHLASTDLVRLRSEDVPPAGAFVIANDESCVPRSVLSRDGPYLLYIAEQSRPRSALPDNGFHAELAVVEAPAEVHVGEKIETRVLVKNESNVIWPGCQHGSRDFQIYLGSHWLDLSEQHWVKEEGRSPLPSDLAPGQRTTVEFALTAPSTPGDYVVELDLVQERVAWFGLKGSHPTRLKIRVE